MNLELEKKRLCNIVLAEEMAKKSPVSLAEMQQRRVPKFLLSYLRTLARRIYHDENPVKVMPSGHYPLKSAIIQQKLDELTALIQMETLFFPDELKVAIKDSVGLQFNFIVNPVKTLTRFFYNSRTVRGRDELTAGIRGIADKRWLFPLLLKRLDNHPGETVSLAEFKNYLEDAQKNAYLPDAIGAFRTDIEVYFELWKSADSTVEYELDPETIITLLNLRSLEELVISFETNSKFFTVFDRHHFIENFSDYFKRKNEPEINAIPIYETEIFCDEIHLEEEDEKKVITDIPVTLRPLADKNFDIDSSVEKELTQKKDDIGEGGAVIESGENLPDLNDYLDTKTRKLLIKKIFNRKEDEFEQFVIQINGIFDWKPAKILLENELKRRNIEPVSREAIKFGDWIFERYFPNQRNIL